MASYSAADRRRAMVVAQATDLGDPAWNVSWGVADKVDDRVPVGWPDDNRLGPRLDELRFLR
jgi:hypothetical protein